MGSPNYFDRFSPVFQESCQNVKPLVHLAVGINEVRIVHSENIVHTDVNIYASQTVFVFEQGHFYGRHITQSAFISNTLNDLTAMFDQLMLVVGHPIVEDNHQIYVTS